MGIPASNLNRRIHETENSFGCSHSENALVVWEDHLAHGTEDFSAQQQKNHKRSQVELPIHYLECSPGQSGSGSRRNTEGADPAGHKVYGDHAHSRAVDLPRFFREDSAPSTALTENLECRDALHAVEEISAQSSVGSTAAKATFSTAPKKDGGSHQCKDGEKEKDEADRKIDGSHEKENDDRGQSDDDHLR